MTRLDQRIVQVMGAMAVLFLASSTYAGDIKGKVTAQGIKSPENIAVYVDAIPGKEFPAPAQRGHGSEESEVRAARPGGSERNHGGFSQ